MNDYGYKDFALEALSVAPNPLTPKEIWDLGVKLGLDKKLQSPAKAPWESLGSWLYTKSSNFGIVREAGSPARFGLPTKPQAKPVGPQKKSQPVVQEPEPPSYTYLQCAEMVLEQFAETDMLGHKQPMHVAEITRIAIEKHWLVVAGLTPINTMSAQLGIAIRRAQSRGLEPTFFRAKNGYYGLTKWNVVRDPLDNLVRNHTKALRQKIREHLATMHPRDFEKLIAILLSCMGFMDVQSTPYSHDKGIDVYGVWNITEGVEQTYAVQVKRQRANVGRPIVANLAGSLQGNDRGMVITTSDFVPGAKEHAKTKNIALINGEQLISLLIEHDLFVSRVSEEQAQEIDRLKIRFDANKDGISSEYEHEGK